MIRSARSRTGTASAGFNAGSGGRVRERRAPGAVEYRPGLRVGVCYQEDAFWALLTLEEHLGLLARLRGVPAHTAADHVHALLEEEAPPP